MEYKPNKKQITVTEEFLEIVDTFVLVATNEPRFYAHVKEWFSPSYNTKLTAGFPVVIGIRELLVLRDKIRSTSFDMSANFVEKRSFIQTMLYLHYVGEFIPEYKYLRITDFYEITRQTPVKDYDQFGDPVWEPEIKVHIEQAEQHFKNVENTMNTLDKFKDQASANVHLIHGRPADTYTESELMALIREAQKNKAAIADLVDTSERVKAKSAQYDTDIAVYVTALDNL